MFYRKHLIVFCSLFIFIACNEDLKIAFTEINVSTDQNSIVEINIPEANGNDMIANHINTKIQKTIISALDIGYQDDATSKSVEESISSFNNQYNTFKNDFPETKQKWDAQIDGEVIYESFEIISIAITAYVNTGGAHGNLNISFLNFNAETGHVIPNSKLFHDVKAFKKTAKPYFDKTVADKDITLNTNSFDLPSNIAYTEDGIVLLYNTNEIAPYSTGIIEFIVPYDKANPYLVFNSF
ncbi:hypothetical protein GCM10023311_13040 [Flaviramulus aquimarinus]|uniref:DUF3298/DUF4163 domain-containing protein n=1 Tax=Flaviramulus aquimarinus TaxID=1170456 RepID=A0ABP9EYC6_9FLAO